MTTRTLGHRNTTNKQKSSVAINIAQQPMISSISSSCLYDNSCSNIEGGESTNPLIVGYSNKTITDNNHQTTASTTNKLYPSMKMPVTSINGINKGAATIAKHTCTFCFMVFAILFSLAIFASIAYMVNQYDDILGQYTVRKSPSFLHHEEVQQPSKKYYFYKENKEKEDSVAPLHAATLVPSSATVQERTKASGSLTKGRHREKKNRQDDKQHQQNVGIDSTVIPNPIKAISILGERNSGTTWMYEHLGECFNHSMPVRRRLTRYKHWFQDESIRTGATVLNDTLVIAMFRNPFEWIEAMRKRPHHASQHIFLGWKDFVTKPWTMDRVGLDLEMTQDEQNNPNACQEEFPFRDIVTCHQRPYSEHDFNVTHYSNHQPFYEMRNDASGEPFGSILELRSAKNRNFLSTKDYHFVKELWIIRYEDMLRWGTAELIRDIVAAVGGRINARCTPTPPQRRARRAIGTDEMKYLLEHVDWESEIDIGYTRTGMRKAKNNSTIYAKIT